MTSTLPTCLRPPNTNTTRSASRSPSPWTNGRHCCARSPGRPAGTPAAAGGLPPASAPLASRPARRPRPRPRPLRPPGGPRRARSSSGAGVAPGTRAESGWPPRPPPSVRRGGPLAPPIGEAGWPPRPPRRRPSDLPLPEALVEPSGKIFKSGRCILSTLIIRLSGFWVGLGKNNFIPPKTFWGG